MRGTLVYLALFLILRFGISRQVGEIGVTDLLVVVLTADASQKLWVHELRRRAEPRTATMSKPAPISSD